MRFKPGVPHEVLRRDDPAACTPEPSLTPSQHVINLLGSDEWALAIEALAMGDTRAERTRRLPAQESPTTIAPGAGDG
ncbi:MAG: hypothetical protein WA747_06055 [Steroidobacteraceae bacterium]